jgi:hypothetical protein
MIYSKTVYYGRSENPYLDLPIASKWFLHLTKCNFEQDDIFYYDRHDLSIRKEEFDTFIDEEHWNHITSTPTVKVLINFSDDYFNAIDVERLSKTILDKNINPSQVYMLVMDENFKTFALELFEKLGIKGINVYHYNFLLKKLNINYTYTQTPDYKFSVLSRNYNPLRLSFYLYLLENDLIKDFIYSFHNYLPYIEQKNISINTVKEDATKVGYEPTSKRDKWIEGLPYDLGNRNSKWIDEINDAISNSNFHLLIESHFDPYLGPAFEHARKEYNIEEFSPAFPTEKTWRVILCKRPFIAASTPYFLKGLKQLGFKTFSPFIDESYDNIENDEDRKSSLLNEIKRIINLPEDERNYIITQCKDICEHNYQLLRVHHNEIKFTNKFDLLGQIEILHSAI